MESGPFLEKALEAMSAENLMYATASEELPEVPSVSKKQKPSPEAPLDNESSSNRS